MRDESDNENGIPMEFLIHMRQLCNRIGACFIFMVIIIILSACTDASAGGLYRDISGKDRSDGQLAMAAAQCRNMVNSYVQPYEGPSGTYTTSTTGVALNRGLQSIARGMSGPNYQDCMLSQGFELVGYE